MRRYQGPRFLQAGAFEAHGQTAVPLLLDELVGPLVPDLDRAGAVLPLGDLALELRVLERMVLDVDSEVLLAGLERHPFGTAQLARAPSRSSRKS